MTTANAVLSTARTLAIEARRQSPAPRSIAGYHLTLRRIDHELRFVIARADGRLPSWEELTVIAIAAGAPADDLQPERTLCYQTGPDRTTKKKLPAWLIRWREI